MIGIILLLYAKRNQLSERNLISICIRSFIIKNYELNTEIYNKWRNIRASFSIQIPNGHQIKIVRAWRPRPP